MNMYPTGTVHDISQCIPEDISQKKSHITCQLNVFSRNTEMNLKCALVWSLGCKSRLLYWYLYLHVISIRICMLSLLVSVCYQYLYLYLYAYLTCYLYLYLMLNMHSALNLVTGVQEKGCKSHS